MRFSEIRWSLAVALRKWESAEYSVHSVLGREEF